MYFTECFSTVMDNTNKHKKMSEENVEQYICGDGYVYVAGEMQDNIHQISGDAYYLKSNIYVQITIIQHLLLP